MGAFIVKQPNGKYARFSTISDCITDYNMTEEDYMQICCERAREEAKDVLERHLRPFDWIIDYFVPNNQNYEEFIEVMKEMGASEDQIEAVEKSRKAYEEDNSGE